MIFFLLHSQIQVKFIQRDNLRFFFPTTKISVLDIDVVNAHSRPMVTSHDFRLSTYVEEADWTAWAMSCSVIGLSLCVVRSDWSDVTGFD